MTILFVLFGLIFFGFSGMVMGAALSCFLFLNAPGWGIFWLIVWLCCK